MCNILQYFGKKCFRLGYRFLTVNCESTRCVRIQNNVPGTEVIGAVEPEGFIVTCKC